MHKHKLCFVCLITLLVALNFMTPSLHAETTSLPIGTNDTVAPTRIEFVLRTIVPPTNTKNMPKDADLLIEDVRQVTLGGLDGAAKVNADISARWPKCHFRVASIVPKEARSDGQEGGERNPPMRVTLLGESGCLTAGK